MNLLENLLAIDPDRRPTADEAEDDIWFYKDPVPRANVGDLMDTIPVRAFHIIYTKIESISSELLE